jgi:hypothetical protein
VDVSGEGKVKVVKTPRGILIGRVLPVSLHEFS